MTSAVNKVVKLVITALIILGLFLALKNNLAKQRKAIPMEEISSKALNLKNHLVKFQKPQRIELTGLSKRFSREIQEMKRLKIPQDTKADFYITIQLFSDETDAAAPLIAQIRFIEIKSGNTIKEESINLD